MLLLELNPKKADDVSRLQQKLETQKSELKAVMRNAGSVFQSGIKPEYADIVKRIRRQIEVTKSELEHAMLAPKITADMRAAAQRIADTQSKVTPEDKKKQHGDSITHGFDHWAELRAQYGDDEGLNKAIHQAALDQTEEGTYELDVTQLANQFKVPQRSMYKRLEDPELFKTSMLMPKNRR